MPGVIPTGGASNGGAREIEVEVIPPGASVASGGRGGAGARTTFSGSFAGGRVFGKAIGGKDGKPGTQLSEILALILDDLFVLPGTKIRFGIDPLLGLIPGIGDMASATAASMIIVTAATRGVPKVVLTRMCLNVMLNAILGAIPGFGDLFSFWFKSNAKNHALLVKHMGTRTQASKGDWLFVGVLLGGIALVVFLVLVVLVTLVRQSFNFWFGGQ